MLSKRSFDLNFVILTTLNIYETKFRFGKSKICAHISDSLNSDGAWLRVLLT